MDKIKSNILTILVFLSGFSLSTVAAYYSIIGLISIFPGAKVAIIAMGATLELAKLVSASWLYRNWDDAPKTIKWYLSVAVVVLMFITSMGIFGFLSKSHLEHQASTSSDTRFQIQTLDTTIEAREKNEKLIERQLNNIDTSLEKYLEKDDVTKGLQQKRRLDKERASLEAERKKVEAELIELHTQRNNLSVEVQKQEVEIGPLKYIAELVYGQESAKDHFDSAVRGVIILLIAVFDPLAIALLLAANYSTSKIVMPDIPLPIQLDIKPKRKYTRRKPKDALVVADENFGIEHKEEPPPKFDVGKYYQS